jgi:hypothetical protein
METKKGFDVFSLFDKPSVIGLVANIDEGKSNLLYYLISNLVKQGNKNIISFGLRLGVGETKIYSLEELERCRDKIIFLDELMTLFDLDNRMTKKQIENTLRLVVHNNNILVLCGLPENFKKFLCGKISTWIYKRVTLEDFINGSSAKGHIVAYHGNERGSEILDLGKGEALVFNGQYNKMQIPYLKEFDTKAHNKPLRIIVKPCVNNSVNQIVKHDVKQNVLENVSEVKNGNV